MQYLKDLQNVLGVKKNLFIPSTISLMQALKLMDEEDARLLIVFKGRQFFSVLSIGDIQRAILKGFDLDTEIEQILRDNITVCYSYQSFPEIKETMLKYRAECMPILSKESRELVSLYFWKDLFEDKKLSNKKFTCPLVLMAGGKGTRMRPLTHVIPKPLIPINEKTISEVIIERFVSHGSQDVFMTVNYKKEVIEFYFGNIKNKPYNIQFVEETKPLGTAGSLKLLEGQIQTSFFVSNCDILVNQDLTEVLSFHKERGHALTILSALSHTQIPYGTLEIENGTLVKMEEKPELTFMINTGVYLLEPEVLKLVPEDKFFHMTDLIDALKKQGHKVGVFPISSGSWQDIGQWPEYLRSIKVGY